jgi:hypothetical protein
MIFSPLQLVGKLGMLTNNDIYTRVVPLMIPERPHNHTNWSDVPQKSS